MTLKPYSADMLDQFALRVLDLVSIVRDMSRLSREYEITDFAVHDKKPNEWLHNLERWLRKSQTELEIKAVEAKARRRALSLGNDPPD